MTPSPDRPRWPRCLLALLVGLAATGGRARAEADERVDIASIDIESLLDLSVQAVTRRLERASAAPATVFVVTGEDIRRQGFRTLSEVLSSVPGLFSYPGNIQQVGVRGMGVVGDFTTRVLLLVDGHPVTNSVGNDVSRGLPVALAAVQRVEVIKGPAGSVYGPSAFFGVVNVVTAAGAPGIELLAGGEGAQGAVRAGEGSAVWRGRRAEAEGLVAVDVYSTRGVDYRFPEVVGLPGSPPGGVSKGMDFGDAESAYLRGSWRGFGASGACGHSNAGLASVLEPNRQSMFETLTCFTELTWQAKVTKDLTLMSRLAYDDFEARAGRSLPPPPVSVGVLHDTGYDRWGSAEVRADWRPWQRVALDAGATFKLHTIRHESGSDPLPVLASRLTKSFSDLNSWTSAEVNVGRNVTLHGGVTFFNSSLFGSQLTPKLAAVWQPTRNDTAKAIYSKGFRPPTFVEALFTDNFAYVKNPEVKPETVSSAELVYEHRFGGVASTSLSLFWNRYDRLIGYQTVAPDAQDPGGGRQAFNSGDVLDVTGGELALTLRWGTALQAYGGVSLQHFGDKDRPNAPGAIANLAVSTRALWAPLLLSARGTAISARTKEPESVVPGQRSDVPASFSLGALAALDVPGVRGLQLELSVQNLLDAANPSPAPAPLAPVEELPESPRTVRADLRWRF
jgi:iron complex outermembrane receptor protein